MADYSYEHSVIWLVIPRWLWVVAMQGKALNDLDLLILLVSYSLVILQSCFSRAYIWQQ